MEYLTHFATAEAANGDIFSTLGIDWRLLVLQIVAFLILVWLLGKFVYPWLMKSVDERQEKIEASIQAADEAKKAADNAGAEVAELLADARKEAAEIVATAKTEANVMVATAESKAKTKADSIVAAARDDIDKEVAAARKTLHNDMIDFVTVATEKVVGSAVAKKDVDESLIKRAIQEGGK